MTAPENIADEPDEAGRVAEAVLSHPSVAALHGGRHGVITTPMPGRKITGVRWENGADPVEIGVVLRLDRPLPEVVGELRARVRSVLGSKPVDITVVDVVTEEPEAGE